MATCENKYPTLTRLHGQKWKDFPTILRNSSFFSLSVSKSGYEGAGEWVRASGLRSRWKQGGQLVWREAGMQPWRSGQAQTSGLIQLPTDSSKHFGSSGKCRSITVALCMAARNMLFHVDCILGWWAPCLEAVVTQCSVRLANCGLGDTTAERGMIWLWCCCTQRGF